MGKRRLPQLQLRGPYPSAGGTQTNTSTRSWPGGIRARRTQHLSRNLELHIPGAPHPPEGMCAGAGAISAWIWDWEMTVGGEKGLDVLRTWSLVPKGPFPPLRDFPGFSKSGQDAPPFRKKQPAGTRAQPWTGALGSRRLRPGRGALGPAADVPS